MITRKVMMTMKKATTKKKRATTKKKAAKKVLLLNPVLDEDTEIATFKSGRFELDVNMAEETVWLTQDQMTELFKTTKQNRSLHIGNIFKEKELQSRLTVKDSLTVQTEGEREVKRKLTFYNLDVIISVGYRVKSNRGTQFRQWANKILKDHLIKGYSLNESRLMGLPEDLKALGQMVGVIEASRGKISGPELSGMVRIVADYARALELLDDFDHGRLTIPSGT